MKNKLKNKRKEQAKGRKKKTDWSAYILTFDVETDEWFMQLEKAKDNSDERVIGARETAKRKQTEKLSAVEEESTLSKRLGTIEPGLNPVYDAPWSPRLDKTKAGAPLKSSAFRLLKLKVKKK